MIKHHGNSRRQVIVAIAVLMVVRMVTIVVKDAETQEDGEVDNDEAADSRV